MVSLPKLTQLRCDRAKIQIVQLHAYPGFAFPRGPGQEASDSPGLLSQSPGQHASQPCGTSVFFSLIYPSGWVSC